MSLETWKASYPVFVERKFEILNLREIVSIRQEIEQKPFVWSARLSTGIFGLPECRSGNSPYVPRGENEIILGLGNRGLMVFIDLGFVPCPTCHPEATPGFWNTAEDVIKAVYPNLSDPKQIINRNLVPFDSRRVDWEAIAPYLSSLPNRLYVPRGLQENDLRALKARFTTLGFKLPPVGYYDRTSPERFTEYKLV